MSRAGAYPAGMRLDTRTLLNLAIAILPVIACSFVGSEITRPQIPVWYAGLVKPWYNPPNWAFPVAWTLLFALMGWAAYRVLRTPAGTPGRSAAITAHFMQLGCNCLWSVAFFGMRSPLLGLVVIVPFLGLILLTIWRFGVVDRLAGRLLWPYAAWVTFATAVNVGIWRLNA
jgi:tryptophan-rich sensory protein